MEKINNLRDLLVDQLNTLCYTKKQQVKNLSELPKKASSEELREVINQHFDESKQQIHRLTEAFEILEEECSQESYEGIDALIKEANGVVDNCETPEVKDAAIIKSLQQVSHYEIASYGCANTYARELELDDLASILHDCLQEEKKADKRLTDIAKGKVNEKAIAED